MIVQKCGILVAETENKPLPKRASSPFDKYSRKI